MATGRRTRCEPPAKPFQTYIPVGSTTTSTTATPCLEYVYLPESGLASPVTEIAHRIDTVPNPDLAENPEAEPTIQVSNSYVRSLCGSMFVPIGSKHNASRGFSLVINNVVTADLCHDKDALVTSEQCFKTITSEEVTHDADLFPQEIILKFAEHFQSNKITIDGTIKILVKLLDGTPIAARYINSFRDKTVLDNAQISLSCDHILSNVKLNNKQIIIEIESVCERTEPTSCDLLPTSFIVEPICDEICASYQYLACKIPSLEYRGDDGTPTVVISNPSTGSSDVTPTEELGGSY